ncbi:MAG: hypothetical protein KAW47_09915, partial [Thermoplasmatales archaeon]|nr:hypothetical protein [Thermoplasmatales archaeon]
MITLPVFLQEKEEKIKNLSLEALKGIQLRFIRSNHEEQTKIFPSIVPIKNSDDYKKYIKVLKDSFSCHLGIGLFDSDFVKESVSEDEDFLLFCPIASGEINNKNILQLFLSEWEAKRIAKFITEVLEILISDTVIVCSNCTSAYTKPFKDVITTHCVSPECPTNFDDIATEDSKILVVIDKQWDNIKEIKKKLKEKNISPENKDIIATSRFEDRRKPSFLRKKWAEGISYTYPKIGNKDKLIIHNFEQKFEYKPSFFHLLAYDAANIAIKILIAAGPDYMTFGHQ